MNKVILFDGSSEHNTYQVAETIHNERKARVLYSGGTAPQSGLALDDNPELLFNYNQRFLEIAESTRPRSILLIGGGAFTLPKALLERFANLHIDVVEIDPLLPKLAKEYFDLQDDDRLNVIVGDGRKYISECQKTYDMIIVDAFSVYDIPKPLLTMEAANQYERCLNKNGLVTVNFIAKYLTLDATLAHRLLATFESVFSTVELYPSDPHYERHLSQNLILVASNEDTLGLDYLQSAPVLTLFTPEDAVLHDEF